MATHTHSHVDTVAGHGQRYPNEAKSGIKYQSYSPNQPCEASERK